MKFLRIVQTHDLTISAVVTNTFDKVKQVFMDDPDANQDFTADTNLGDTFSLSGTVSTVNLVQPYLVLELSLLLNFVLVMLLTLLVLVIEL